MSDRELYEGTVIPFRRYPLSKPCRQCGASTTRVMADRPGWWRCCSSGCAIVLSEQQVDD